MSCSCSVCDAQIKKVVSERRKASSMHELSPLFVLRAMWKQGRNIVPTLRYFVHLWSFTLIIRSQLCHFISSTALTLCLCSLQITSELPHSEVSCYSFKNKILARSPGKKKNLCKDLLIARKWCSVSFHCLQCTSLSMSNLESGEIFVIPLLP